MYRKITRLQQAAQELGLDGEFSLASTWLKIQGERCPVNVIEVGWGIYYNTWCEDEDPSRVYVYSEPDDAIRGALELAAMDPRSRVRQPGRPLGRS